MNQILIVAFYLTEFCQISVETEKIYALLREKLKNHWRKIDSNFFLFFVQKFIISQYDLIFQSPFMAAILFFVVVVVWILFFYFVRLSIAIERWVYIHVYVRHSLVSPQSQMYSNGSAIVVNKRHFQFFLLVANFASEKSCSIVCNRYFKIFVNFLAQSHLSNGKNRFSLWNWENYTFVDGNVEFRMWSLRKRSARKIRPICVCFIEKMTNWREKTEKKRQSE